MYNKQLSPNPPAAAADMTQNRQQQQQQQQHHFVEEHTPDSAAEEAIAWSSLCDQFTRNLLKLELQVTESNYRTDLVEEESSLRVFIYNSLLLGITSQSARLSAQFSDLMSNVRTLQNNHDRLINEKQTHASAIAEYHAQQIMEQRSQAETQAVNYQHRIENLREDERDLRVRVENLRREAEESQGNLEKRRNDSLEERRTLENDLQRLQNEVGNQKYLLDRLNAQVDSSKQKLRESERYEIERRSISGGQQQQNHFSTSSARQSPIPPTSTAGNYMSNNNGATTPRPAAATPLTAVNNSRDINNQYYQQQQYSASPDRHGDSIASGISNIQALRDSAIDTQFMRSGKITPVRVPPQFHQQSANNNSSRTPVNVDSSNPYRPVGLSSTAQRSLSGNYNSSTYSPATTNLHHANSTSASSRTPAGPSSSSNGGGLFERNNSTTPGGASGSGGQPSQWQLRLMKLQGELKSLKSDLGVASPK